MGSVVCEPSQTHTEMHWLVHGFLSSRPEVFKESASKERSAYQQEISVVQTADLDTLGALIL